MRDILINIVAGIAGGIWGYLSSSHCKHKWKYLPDGFRMSRKRECTRCGKLEEIDNTSALN